MIEDRVRDLHVDQQLVVFVSVRLHALVSLFEFVVLLAKLAIRVGYFDADLVRRGRLVKISLGRAQTRIVIQLAF